MRNGAKSNSSLLIPNSSLKTVPPFLFGEGSGERDLWPCPASEEDYRQRVAAMRWLSRRQADEWLITLVMENYLNIDVLRFWFKRGESIDQIRTRCLRFWFPSRFAGMENGQWKMKKNNYPLSILNFPFPPLPWPKK